MARALRRRPIAAAALALSGLAAGCSGAEDPEPATPEPTPVTSAPSASPSPSPSAEGVDKPERPAAMDQHDADGAAAAAEYFLSLRSYIMKTGDTAEWEAMSHESCDFCNSGLDQAKQIAQRGDVFEGGRITARVVEGYERDPVTGIWPFDVEMDEAATRIVDSNGEVLLDAERSVEVNRVEIGLVDDQWVVVTVASVPEE